MKRFIVVLLLLPAFIFSIGQNVEKLNDSTISNFLSAYQNTCKNLFSRTTRKINIRSDRRALENTTKLILKFRASGELTNITDHFELIRSVTVGNTTKKKYVCFSSNRGGNVDIYLEHEEDRENKKDIIRLHMLTSSHLYCADDNRLVATFDALYLRKILQYIGFRFRLDKWEDQFYFKEERKWQ